MARFLIKTLVLIVFLSLLITCNKFEFPATPYPTVETLPVTNISGTGATFNAKIISKNDEDIIEYGFVWGEKENPDLQKSEKIIMPEVLTDKEYSIDISSALREGVKYFVRSFVHTEKYTVYGDNVEFTSLGSKSPVIDSFYPATGTWGDTITVVGKHFSYINGKNIGYLGNVRLDSLYSTDTLVKFIIPPVKNIETVNLSVVMFGNRAEANGTFSYIMPKIVNVSSLEAAYSDTVSVDLDFINSKYTEAFFNNHPARIIRQRGNSIDVEVPNSLEMEESTIKVTSAGFSDSVSAFRLKMPHLISIDLSAISKPKEVLTITGENLNSEYQFTEISITYPLGTYVLYNPEILKLSQNKIEIKLGEAFFGNLLSSLSGEAEIVVKNFNFTTNQISIPINYRSTWTKKKDFPGAVRNGAVAFSLNNKGYIGTGIEIGVSEYLNDFWEYDPELDEWRRIEDLPGIPRINAVAFAINNIGYVGLGTDQHSDNPDYWNLKDFYSYDAQSGHWTRITDFQGVGRYSAAAFSINNKGYIAGGWCPTNEPYSRLGSDFWQFDPITTTWQQLPDFPHETAQAVGFNIGNDGYVYDYNALYKYDGNTWTLKNAAQLSSKDLIGFSISGLGYFGLGDNAVDGPSDYLYEYNPQTETSVNRPIPQARRGTVAFTINNKAYIIGGDGKYGARLGDVWEFDPTKPEQ